MMNGLSKTDKVRVFLNSQGKSYIVVGNLTDLATNADMERNAFYQALYRLQQAGELEIESDFQPESNRKVVVGIRVKKLASLPSIATGVITNRDKGQKANTSPNIAKPPTLPNISQYIHKKTVLDEIAQKLASEGFTDDAVQINFTPDPVAEEAMQLLDLLQRASETISSLAEENKKLSSDNQIYEEMINGTKPQGVDALARK